MPLKPSAGLPVRGRLLTTCLKSDNARETRDRDIRRNAPPAMNTLWMVTEGRAEVFSTTQPGCSCICR